MLRALELEGMNGGDEKAKLSDRLGTTSADLTSALALLEATGQVKQRGGRWTLEQVLSVNTSHDRQRSLSLEVSWTETALARMRAGAPGNYGYSVFSITKNDLRGHRGVPAR